ncbi:MAG: arginine repressor [Melioribacteraceae bacterium]|nr:arginine repressor [Melioribacteraceae bacterium]
MTKKLQDIHKRHSLIKTLISSQDVFNQTQLVKLLKQNGIKVTQATLSRDLTELGVVRVPTTKGVVYKIDSTGVEKTLQNHLSEEIVSVQSNESIIVLKTFPGRAQGVALFIDKNNLSEIIGTVAGDDTIIIVPKSIKSIDKTIQQLKNIIGFK